MKIKRKVLIVFAIIIASIFVLIQNTSYAESGNLGLKLSYKRYTSAEGWGYALNNGTVHPIYQILKVNGNNILGTNYFCLDPNTSHSWNYRTITDDDGNKYNVASSIDTLASYTDYYDMENVNLSDLDKFSSKSAVIKNYKQIMWILDNMYIASEDNGVAITKNPDTDTDVYSTRTTEKIEELFSKFGIKYQESGTIGEKTLHTYTGDRTNSYFNKYKANILYSHTSGGYHYADASNNQIHSLLNAEQIEAIEQAAIWYFTNYYKVNNDNTNGDEQYNIYVNVITEGSEGGVNRFSREGKLRYTSGADTKSYNWPLLNSITTNNADEGKMLQEQATILYNYLIDAANDYAENNENYVANSNPITITSTKVDTQTVGTNKVLGKFKITRDATNATPYTLDDEIQILDTDGNPISGAKIVNSNGTQINKTASQLVGQDFYVSVPSNSNINKVIVKVTGNYDTTKKLLWLSSETEEQPIVEIQRISEPFDKEASIEEEKKFDLALRKVITGVTKKNGDSIAIFNEDGLPAERNLTYNINSLKTGTGTTAAYNHRKDPVVIEKGDTVTYSITVYNEGSKKGYASEIIDKLPNGLVLKEYAKNGTTTGNIVGTTVIPTNMPLGGVTASEHSYEYDPETNILTITGENILHEYGEVNDTSLSRDVFSIECEATADPSDTYYQYFTNIAYISKAYDAEFDNGDGTYGKEIISEVGADRDSEPSTKPTATQVTTSTTIKGYNGWKGSTENSVYSGTNNDIYFEGQQDDDDFEIVVMLPKEYDLALRKFITAVSSDETIENGEYLTSDKNAKSDNNEYTRAPIVNTSNLKAGTATTAIYEHSKDAVEVKRDDYVLYTLRVYNEGEFDTYASKITDHLPTYLDYVDCEFNRNYGWNKLSTDSTGKTIATDYLSSANETETNKTVLKAFDSENDNGEGSGLSYRDVQILVKVNKNAISNKNITNIAEISEYQNATGTVIPKDRDSSSNNIGTKADLSQNVRPDYDGGSGTDRTDKYIPGQEDDDDFERVFVKRFDLALRKQIIKIEHKETNQTVNYNEGATNSRFAVLDNSINNTIYSYYDVEHNIPVVTPGDIVTYSIRVYNEGEVDGTATWVTDILPSGLEYIVDNEINQNNEWKAYKHVASTVEGAIKIGENYYKEVPYTSSNIALYATQKLSEETITAYTGSGEADYKDVYMVARVKDKSELAQGETYSLRNYAEIGDDDNYDEDSTPGNDIDRDRREEDDLDLEDLQLPEGKYELDIVKTDKKGNVIKDLVTGFSINNSAERRTVNGVLKFGETQIESTATIDTYVIKEITPPDTYSKFDGKIEIKVAKRFRNDKYEVDVANTTITVYDAQGNVLANGQTESKEIGITLTATTTKVQVNVEDERLDLSLRKFITAISDNINLENAEYLTTDKKAKTENNEYTRAPQVDTSKLKTGEETTAIYNHTKEAVPVKKNNYVIYTIRVYNEGEADVYASKITDHLPTYLDYVDCKFNQDFGWNLDEEDTTRKTVITDYLSKANENDTNKTILKAYDSKNDNGKGSRLSYRDIQILARVNENAKINTNITNIAEISEYQEKDGSIFQKDRDSESKNLTEEILKQDIRPDYNGGTDTDTTDEYIPGQEDDDDFERVIIKRFDLALRKQIVKIEHKETNQTVNYIEGSANSRFATLDKSINNTIYSYYDVEHNIPVVTPGDIVTYSIRVYNEGEVNGTATWVTDRLPSGLEYLPQNEVNIENGWKAYKEVSESESGSIKIGEKYYKEVEYTSNDITLYATQKLSGESIKAYTGMGNADYKEVYMVARVKAKNEIAEGITYKLRNIAEIGDDNGEDEDSTPGNDSEIKEEDDLDIEELQLPEGKYELDIVKTDTKGNVIKDLVTGFSINNSAEQKTVDGVLKFGQKQIESTSSKDVYVIKEITPPDTYSKFDGKIEIKVAKRFRNDKYEVDVANTTITVYDAQGNVLANGQTESKEIGITLTATTTKVQVNVEDERLDLSLRKFITAISDNINLENAEYLTTDKKAKTENNEYTRAPQVDTSKLKTGEETTAIYNHTKEAITTKVNNYVIYTIRVYNEGEADMYAAEITDHLPTYLDYIDCKFNQDFGWTIEKNGKTVKTNYLSKEKETDTNKTVLKAFDSKNDNGKGSGLYYRDVQILVRVNENALSNTNITNIAEVSKYQDIDGSDVKEDRDSKPENLGEDILKQEVRPDYNGGEDKDKTDNYIPGQEDDDDFERIIVKKFDLALRKQIVNIQNAYTKQDEKHDRFAKLDTEKKEKNTIYNYYDVDNNIPQVVANDIVTYSIRVYNEGEVDGTATWVTDRMPSGLEYLVDNDTNKKYGWKAYKEVAETEEGAIKIGEKSYKEVEYTSKDITLYATEYLKGATIKAYTGEGEADYKEVYMVARVKDKKEVTGTEYKLRNTAEIGDDTGDDDDSTPGDDSSWKEEDDLDIEDLKLVEFDLALLKYVSTVYVTEDGKETITQTNNVGNDKTDIIPKVEVNRKKLNKTVVKFGYTIKITNEGDIAGYAKEITDYVPEGLKFYAEDNQGWTDEGNNVISTKLLENTLLQPGESAQVTVILRWINGSENLGVKINIAEISEDYNDKHVPDRDSTPDNKKPGEDDIDDAPVLLSIKTGLGENVMMYVGGSLIILVVLGIGISLIKKYVL